MCTWSYIGRHSVSSKCSCLSFFFSISLPPSLSVTSVSHLALISPVCVSVSVCVCLCNSVCECASTNNTLYKLYDWLTTARLLHCAFVGVSSKYRYLSWEFARRVIAGVKPVPKTISTRQEQRGITNGVVIRGRRDAIRVSTPTISISPKADENCSLVRRFYSPKVRKSEIKGSSFRRFCSPKVRKSETRVL